MKFTVYVHTKACNKYHLMNEKNEGMIEWQLIFTVLPI